MTISLKCRGCIPSNHCLVLLHWNTCNIVFAHLSVKQTHLQLKHSDTNCREQSFVLGNNLCVCVCVCVCTFLHCIWFPLHMWGQLGHWFHWCADDQGAESARQQWNAPRWKRRRVFHWVESVLFSWFDKFPYTKYASPTKCQTTAATEATPNKTTSTATASPADCTPTQKQGWRQIWRVVHYLPREREREGGDLFTSEASHWRYSPNEKKTSSSIFCFFEIHTDEYEVQQVGGEHKFPINSEKTSWGLNLCPSMTQVLLVVSDFPLQQPPCL